MNKEIPVLKRQKIFALCGIIAPILFTFTVIIASLLRPDYSQISNFVSDLGVGPNSIIQNVNFIIFGILVIIFSFGLGCGMPSPRGKALKTGVWLLVLFGFFIILAGVTLFSVGPDVTYAQEVEAHGLVSAMAFLTIIAAQLLIWRGLRDADSSVWGRYGTYSLISGLLSIFLLLALRIAIGGGYQGIVQRAFLAVPWIWIEMTGIKLYLIAKK